MSNETEAQPQDSSKTQIQVLPETQQPYQGICLQCRREFQSHDEFQAHMQSDCWASFNERILPNEWTPALINYVERALDPANSNPEWSNQAIVSKVLNMIETNRRLKSPIDWNVTALPQFSALNEGPKKKRRTKRKNEPAWVERPYPDPYYADGNEHSVRELFKHEYGKPFIAKRDEREMLIFIDGVSSHQGRVGAQGGCAFVFRCSDGIPTPWALPKGVYCMNGAYFFRLEDVGPTGKPENPTALRAELRAAVAALFYLLHEAKDLEFWTPKQQATLVVATDSNYVVDGATKWCRSWEYEDKWRLSNGQPVKNQDLWELLLRGVRELQETRCEKVYFWIISKDQNETADRMAKYAENLERRPRYGIPAPGSIPTLIETIIEPEETAEEVDQSPDTKMH